MNAAKTIMKNANFQQYLHA